MSLLTELRRRNVIRVALFYIVSAWLVVQVAETLLPIFDVPDGVLRAIVLILVLGFVPALVFAWAFELTPEGLKRDKDVERVDPVTKRQTARKLNLATLIAAVLAIGLLGADRMLSGGSDSRPSAAPGTTDLSIAVLPFVNMSAEPENAFFADGISEELLNILAGVDGLRVASRTSAFSFKGQTVPIPVIAETLGVRHVLEGSVRRQGDRVRITAQLIDAETDAHLWSDTYERELNDIFRVQETIATAITGELMSVLGGAAIEVDAPTEDLEAYQRFLRGRSMFYRRESLDDAIADLRWAVERDPMFAEAWAFLAATEYVQGSSGYPTELDRDDLSRRAVDSAERALALDPDIAIALAIKGNIATDGGPSSFKAGMELLERAAATETGDTSPQLWFAIRLLELGNADRALEVLTAAQARDPLVPINLGYLGVAETILGDRAAGARRALRTVELNGQLSYWALLVTVDAVRDGEFEEALALIESIQAARQRQDQLPDEQLHLDWLAESLTDAADTGTLRPLDDAQISALDPFLKLAFFVAQEDEEDAIAVAAERGGTHEALLFMLGWFPSTDSLREHPGFLRIAEESGPAGYWESNGYPLGCRPVDGADGRRLDCPETGP
ncbi:MAG: tetratricopeptide repeat protein [Wenzhouxiangellaceae bacterium]|nr:tetratricopeptide repeat protein [Wenzhouxiangellaceae bacterium]